MLAELPVPVPEDEVPPVLVPPGLVGEDVTVCVVAVTDSVLVSVVAVPVVTVDVSVVLTDSDVPLTGPPGLLLVVSAVPVLVPSVVGVISTTVVSVIAEAPASVVVKTIVVFSMPEKESEPVPKSDVDVLDSCEDGDSRLLMRDQ